MKRVAWHFSRLGGGLTVSYVRVAAASAPDC